MGEIRAAYLVVLLVSISFGVQTVVAQEYEYEYYYEEANGTMDYLSTAVETTTVTLVQEEQATSEASKPLILPNTVVESNTDMPSGFTSVITVEESTDDILNRNDWSTAAIDENKPWTTTDVRRTDEILTLLNGTRPTKYNSTIYKPATKPNTQPGIVLNIYTGLYGMHSRGQNRPSGNLGGRNNFWPRAQHPLQGWYGMYGMYNRRPMQSFMPRQNPPIYRGRGPQNGYDDRFNSFTYHTATKPRRNKQQNRGPAIDEQASLAVFNFLLQALGQRTGSSSSRSQSQVQQVQSRRRF